jgi:hypothetical protein
MPHPTDYPLISSQPEAAPAEPVPPLRHGDRLTRAEFERRFNRKRRA